MKKHAPHIVTAIAIDLHKSDGIKTGFMSKTTLFIIAGILWFLFFMLCLNAGAQEKLTISPTRIVLDNNTQSGQILITNHSADTLRYNVAFTEMYMKDNGKLVAGNSFLAGVNPASQYLAMSADKLELAPGQSKAIIITLNAAGIQDGESRSHIQLKREQLPADTPKVKSGSAPLSVTLPVIVRKGAYDTRLSLSNMTIVTNGDAPSLSLTLRRAGNMSAFGDIVVSYTDSTGNPVVAGLVKGVAIYTPNADRRFRVPLKKLPGHDYDLSRMNIAFIAGDKNLLPVAGNAALAIQKK